MIQKTFECCIIFDKEIIVYNAGGNIQCVPVKNTDTAECGSDNCACYAV